MTDLFEVKLNTNFIALLHFDAIASKCSRAGIANGLWINFLFNKLAIDKIKGAVCKNMDKKLLIVLKIVVLIVVAAGAYFLGYRLGYQTGYSQGVEAGKAAAKVEAGQAVTNPLEKMPSINPFEGVINPFKDLYRNPFK